jgi:hypothetical protein
MPDPATSSLTLAEGVELGYALVTRAADDVGARVLVIKGLVNEAHGLREPHVSADVDVLVEPTRLQDVVAGLCSHGWTRVPLPPVASPFGAHSVALAHARWPCEIDVHDRFPGFLADPSQVFETLWEDRADVTLGHVHVPATGLHGTALILALHALRTPHASRSERELAGLVRRAESRGIGPGRLLTLAEATGCTTTARPLLAALGVDPGPSAAADRAVQEWELRRLIGPTRNLGWLIAARRTPPWRWPALLLRVLLSTEPMLRHHYPQAPPGRRGLWLARWWRLRLAVRDLPRAVRAARRLAKVSR